MSETEVDNYMKIANVSTIDPAFSTKKFDHSGLSLRNTFSGCVCGYRTIRFWRYSANEPLELCLQILYGFWFCVFKRIFYRTVSLIYGSMEIIKNEHDYDVQFSLPSSGELVVFFLSKLLFSLTYLYINRSQWPHGLRRRTAAARLLRLWVRIPPGAWIFVCCECCVLSGRGLCDVLITRSEQSYRLWCVVVC